MNIMGYGLFPKYCEFSTLFYLAKLSYKQYVRISFYRISGACLFNQSPLKLSPLPPTIRYAFGMASLTCISCLACPEWNMSYIPSAYTLTGRGAIWNKENHEILTLAVWLLEDSIYLSVWYKIKCLGINGYLHKPNFQQ